jgi:hypothetical protein
MDKHQIDRLISEIKSLSSNLGWIALSICMLGMQVMCGASIIAK